MGFYVVVVVCATTRPMRLLLLLLLATRFHPLVCVLSMMSVLERSLLQSPAVLVSPLPLSSVGDDTALHGRSYSWRESEQFRTHRSLQSALARALE